MNGSLREDKLKSHRQPDLAQRDGLGCSLNRWDNWCTCMLDSRVEVGWTRLSLIANLCCRQLQSLHGSYRWKHWRTSGEGSPLLPIIYSQLPIASKKALISANQEKILHSIQAKPDLIGNRDRVIKYLMMRSSTWIWLACRKPREEQKPPVLPYLQEKNRAFHDINLFASIQPEGATPSELTRTNFQQL